MSSESFGSPASACKHAGMLDPLATNRVVLVDGGMGTELEARGARMDNEAWSGLANLEEPGLVRDIHEDYIRAGAVEARERAGRAVAIAESMSLWGPHNRLRAQESPPEEHLLEVYGEQAAI